MKKCFLGILCFILVSGCQNPWLTQKTTNLEVGVSQICDLVNCTDEVLVGYHPKPDDPYPLGPIDITFIATKGEVNKDITFTYNVVDTTPPVIEKVKETVFYLNHEIDPRDYIIVNDNSGENLIDQVTTGNFSTLGIGEFTAEMTVKDSSGNQGTFAFQYSIIDPLTLAPDLLGTKKILQTIDGLERITYIAEAGNLYGIQTGLYVGEFRKEVSFEGELVGGVLLIPKVVEYLVKKSKDQKIFVNCNIKSSTF